MKVALKDSMTLGILGLLAVMIYLLVLFVALLTVDGFSIDADEMSELGASSVYTAGCAISGVLAFVLGLCAIVWDKDSIFIGKIRNILTMLVGVVLIVWALIGFNDDMLIPFEIVAVLIMLSDTGYGWVSDARIRMSVSAVFLVLVLGSSVLGLLNGMASVLLFVGWAMLSSLRLMIRYRSEEESQKISIEDEIPPEKEYSKKSMDSLPVEVVIKPLKSVHLEGTVKSDVPSEKSSPNVEIKKESNDKPETLSKPKGLPSLNVMSSRDAAVARDVRKSMSLRVEDICDLSDDPDGISTSCEEVGGSSDSSIPTLTNDEVVVSEPDSYDSEEVLIQQDTPDVLVRRAAWNKGLRCRRDYGEHRIPVAFVKGKVAVFVMSDSSDILDHDSLVSEGWTVLSYQESEITDGKLQGEEIYRAVKDNLRKGAKRKRR